MKDKEDPLESKNPANKTSKKIEVPVEKVSLGIMSTSVSDMGLQVQRTKETTPSQSEVAAPELVKEIKLLKEVNSTLTIKLEGSAKEVIKHKQEVLNQKNLLKLKEQQLEDLKNVLLAAESRFKSSGWAVTDTRVLHTKLHLEYEEKYGKL